MAQTPVRKLTLVRRLAGYGPKTIKHDFELVEPPKRVFVAFKTYLLDFDGLGPVARERPRKPMLREQKENGGGRASAPGDSEAVADAIIMNNIRIGSDRIGVPYVPEGTLRRSPVSATRRWPLSYRRFPYVQ